MKAIILSIFNILLFSSCQSQSPTKVFQDTKAKFFNQNKVSFNQITYSPNPAGKIDTFTYIFEFLKNPSSLIGYNTIIDGPYFDYYIKGEEYKSVNHFKKVVELYSDQKPAYAKAVFESSDTYQRSPMFLLQDIDWQFVKDTLINSQVYNNYVNVINDKVIDGNTVYTEQHLFINPQSKLIERWERRNYFKGKLSQRVVSVYNNYIFSDDNSPLSFSLPTSYPSVLFSQKTTIPPLEKGEKAPEFDMKDLQGNSVSLADFKGNKVLLKFSSVGCGNSHEALLYMNQENFQLPENIKPIYLSMWDKKADVIDYFSKVTAGMPVLSNSEDIAKAYKISSTPTFVLINEDGVIENVVIGNHTAFLNGLIQNDGSAK
ncbi:TlpA family protein disulfide reductase [Algoriphagus halophilus]|uniref:AhpC/TSA family protein n=1 Tax=Algoriphagus halophilus TaxID=226505 RepID=A0A1N6HW38_9BACT|nr:TlpA disulfide reductase family protein [Algoriphagus halophilus]SIO23976.1 AhpC/TSA family protein [Algoriphagus halophilus]